MRTTGANPCGHRTGRRAATGLLTRAELRDARPLIAQGVTTVPASPSVPHPRNNGAFARRLAVYVRERNVISLEQAIRTMTSLPARVFGFADRGEIRPGAFADVVIFDPARVVDRATYTDPHQLADGIDWVIVNGLVARQDGQFTGARAGRVLRR